MKKKVYIIHGWGADSHSDRFPWAKQILSEKGCEVIVPDMPNTETPVIDVWVNYLKDVLSMPDENTYLIGHSIGCQTIMRYLGSIESIKIAGIIFVAGWFTLKNLQPEELPIAKPWLDMPIDYDKVKYSTENIIALFSDNDPVVPVENEKLFADRLGAKTMMLHGKGHMNAEDGIFELQEIFQFIK